MSEIITVLDAVKLRMVEVNGESWIDEILIRGSKNGIVGAHLVIGWEAPGAMGTKQTGLTNPQVLNIDTGDPLWEGVKEELGVAAIQQINSLTLENQQLTALLIAAQNRVAELEAGVANSTEEN